jgi:hypothetical protein
VAALGLLIQARVIHHTPDAHAAIRVDSEDTARTR